MSNSLPDNAMSTEIDALQKPLRGRRFLSWAGFILTVGILLVLPIVASVWPAAFRTTAAAEQVQPARASGMALGASLRVDASSGKISSVNSTFKSLDVPWNPGQVSNAHQPWANDCKVCHSVPFARVKDTDCLACHANMGGHVDAKHGKVASLTGASCASCHRDHQGEFGLSRQNKQFIGTSCAACHADIRTSMPKTTTLDVKDFSSGHPEFRVQIATGADRLERVLRRTHTRLVETTGLKFPHDVHLATAGVSSPKGVVKMACDTCHKPNADGITFAPVTMKDHCQSCHALKFEPAVSNREVPHGPAGEVISTLREFYSYVSVNGVPVDDRTQNGPIFFLRPGKPDPVKSYIGTPGNARHRAVASATELFEKTACIVCHTVTRSAEQGAKGTPGEDMPLWKIAPVGKQHAWMPKAVFSHARHLTARCSDCHDAAGSKEAGDVLMPVIAQCRDCHAGKEPVVGKVTSDCGLCHAFHLPAVKPPSAMPAVHPIGRIARAETS